MRPLATKLLLQLLVRPARASHWQQLFTAEQGVAVSCPTLDSTQVQPGDFPQFCFAHAVAVGADTFDADADGSRCYFKRCRAFSDLRLTGGARHAYTLLVGGWRRLARGFESTCDQFLGGHVLRASDEFPLTCQLIAAARGGDTFDAEVDGSRCYFKRCGSLSAIGFSASSVDTYSLLVGDWQQLTTAAEGVAADCPALGVLSSEDCASQTVALGGDTFESNSSSCVVKRCGKDVRFTNSSTGQDTHSLLGGSWAQVAWADAGFVADCTYVGSHELVSAEDFPLACYSHARALGGDTLDVLPNRSECVVKRCGSLRLGVAEEGRDVFTLLAGTWNLIAEGLMAECPEVGSYEALGDDPLPECYSRALGDGADTVDINGSQCVFKRCGEFRHIRLSGDAGNATETHTLLQPLRDGCVGCVDISIFYTAGLKGGFLPVDRYGFDCDPEDSSACFGGNARRAAYVQQCKATGAEHDVLTVITDLGGSSFGGAFFGHPSYPWGKPAALLQDLVGYDFELFGAADLLHSNDTEEGQTELAQSYASRTTPLLLSNVRFSGVLAALNKRIEPYKVVALPNGVEVGFVGMYCHTTLYTYGFHPSNLELDPSGLLVKILNGSLDGLQLDLTSFRDDLQRQHSHWASMGGHHADVYRLATIVSVDTLAAAMALQAAHPRVRALVLLSTACRSDLRLWMLENGPFDVILESGSEHGWDDPVLLRSRVYHKQRLFASSTTERGIGHLQLRVGPTGVEDFDFEPDLPLGADIPSDAQVHEQSAELYRFIRKRDAEPCGNISAPLTGTYLKAKPPTMNQCYYTDCPGGDHLGRAFLWFARAAGFKVDVAIMNLGAFRAPLEGKNGTVSVGDTTGTLKFREDLEVFTVSGANILRIIKSLLNSGEFRFLFAGLRIAVHEPCWHFVDHTSYSNGGEPEWRQPGTPEEIQRCKQQRGLTEVATRVIDVEIADCGGRANCNNWRQLQKGAMYTVVSVFFVATNYGENFQATGEVAGDTSVALCSYIKAHSTLQVESWEAYHERGALQYKTAAEGFASGSSMPSVNTTESLIDNTPPCLDGDFQPPGTDECQPCEPGTRSVMDIARDRCLECPAGFFANGSGRATCLPCPEGTNGSQPGLSECSVCQPGHYSLAGVHCQKCQVGQFAPVAGSGSCQDCPAGRYTAGEGSFACKECGPGLCGHVSEESLSVWMITVIMLFVALFVALVAGGCVCWRRRVTQSFSVNLPTDLSMPCGSWTAKWIGLHVFLKLSLRTRTFTSRTLEQVISRPWLINSTPWTVQVTYRRMFQAISLPPFTSQKAPVASQEELEVEVTQMAGRSVESWQSLPKPVLFELKPEAWCKGYDSPVMRIGLPDAEGNRRLGQLRIVKGPEGLLVFSWSPPPEVRGMPLDEFERFLVEVQESARPSALKRLSVSLVIKEPSRSMQETNMYTACSRFLLKEVSCLDASYAELRTNYGPPDLFISHVWSESAKNTLRAVRNLQKAEAIIEGRPTYMDAVPSDCKVWFCTACNNQSRVQEELGEDVQTSPFARVITSPECSKVALVSPFLALSRKWCTFEFSLARHAQKSTVLVTTSGVVEAGQVAPKTLDELAKQVCSFSSMSASCSSTADARMIDAAVEQMGGYGNIDTWVREACKSAIEEAHRYTSDALEALEIRADVEARTVSTAI